MVAESVKQYFATIQERFVADKAKGVNATFQFELAGDNAGTYHLVVNDGTVAVVEGAHEKPTVTIKMTGENFIKMSNSELSGQMAFMSGKMKVVGNVMMAQKMANFLPPHK